MTTPAHWPQILMRVRKNPGMLHLVGLTPDLSDYLVKNSWKLMRYVPKEHQTEEMIEDAILQSKGLAYACIDKQRRTENHLALAIMYGYKGKP